MIAKSSAEGATSLGITAHFAACSGIGAILETRNLTRRVMGKFLGTSAYRYTEARFWRLWGRAGPANRRSSVCSTDWDEPTGGTVYLDGRDFRELPPRELRRRVGMVMQSAYMFPGAVADNLRHGPRQRGEELSGRGNHYEVGIAGFLIRIIVE